VTVGTPVVAGASVSATVLGEALGPKLVIFKFKQKVKYRRRTGHRQHLTRVRIDEIHPTAARKAAAPVEKADQAETAEKKTEAKPRAKAKAAPRVVKPRVAKAAPPEAEPKARAPKPRGTAKTKAKE
jgi:large subunit ribosomal protein L21